MILRRLKRLEGCRNEKLNSVALAETLIARATALAAAAIEEGKSGSTKLA